MKFLSSFLTLAVVVLLTGCTGNKKELGGEDNPIKLFFVPSVDATLIADKGKLVQDYLEKQTGYKFKIAVPSSFVAVVEAFGTNRADVAALNTFGYILAHSKYGAQAKLTFIRYGNDTYKAQIIARSDSKISSLKDINGKKFAYVDPASTSGYLLPAKLFFDNDVKPAETVFAQKHDNVVTMVYQKQVDAGATFYSPEHDGKIEDARRLVLTQFPDVKEKVKIVQLTDSIPNDPIVFRKDLPEEMKTKIVKAFLDYMKTEEGKTSFHALYGVTEMKEASDANYDSVRKALADLGKDVNEMMKK